MFKNFTLFSCMLLATGAFAQNAGHYCGTQTVEQQIRSNPDLSEAEKEHYLQEHAKSEEEINKRAAEYRNGSRKGEVRVIPVVFHIFHNYGPENISDAQVYDQLRIMNEEFNARNAKLSQVIPEFQDDIGNTEIEFRLATIDPQGKCTNGINRYQHNNPYFTEKGPIESLKRTYIWPRNKYLNCFIVGSIGSDADGTTLGYAQFPSNFPGSDKTDGLVMVHYGIGSIGTGNSTNQSVSTHEVGHWLGLSHTWGNCASAGDPAACGCDDGITDTPNTKGSPSVCNLNESSCGVLANVQNFMDYSFCYAMFTKGQSAKMRATLESTVAQRNSLWSALNLAATGTTTATPSNLCKADFLPATKLPICAGATMSYIDHSFFNVQSYQWEFEGGVPSTSTDKNPTVTYPNPGTYKVKLTVTDGNATETTTKDSVVTVVPVNLLPGNYSQTFEALSLQNDPDFKVYNPDNDKTWVINPNAAYAGSRSIYIQNRLIATQGRIDELTSGTLDLTEADTLSFRYAYAMVNSASSDELQIHLSDDCGLTYTKVRTLKGSLLKTGANTAATTEYIPAANEWKLYKYGISNLFKKEGVRIKFVWINAGGNNFYMDNLNIAETVGVEEINPSLFALNVFPNPMDESSEINFVLDHNTDVEISMFDLLGKKVQSIYSGNLAPGEHAYRIARNNLKPGIYFVKVSAEGKNQTRKLILK